MSAHTPQQLSLRARAAHLLSRGYNTVALAQELGVSITRARHLVASCENMWHEEIVRSISLIKARQMVELGAVKRAAWEGWDRTHGAPEVKELYDSDEEAGAGAGAEVVGGELELSPGVTLVDSLDQMIDEVLHDVGGIESLTPEAREVLRGANEDVVAALMQRANPSPVDYSEDPVAWEREAVARLEAHRIRTTTPIGDTRSSQGKKIKGMAGDPAYLKLVLESIAQERAIMGTDAPRRQMNLNITPEGLREMSDDELERKIRKLGGTELLDSFAEEAESSSGDTQPVVARRRDVDYTDDPI